MLHNIKNNFQLWGGCLSLGLIFLSAIAAPWMSPFPPNAQISPALSRYSPPSANHVFGTDQFGRDVFARVLYGGRITLLIAGIVVVFSVLLGALYGALSGYLGGIWDLLLMRIVDVLLAFPIIFLAVTCMALFGSGLFWLMLVIILTSWMDIARMIRAEVHVLKNSAFVIKARATGINTLRIIWRHLLPNAMATVIAVAVVRVADIILIESALSFLGLGVQPPTASWGTIINDGRTVISEAWWITAFPGFAIASTVISLNMIGEGLQSLLK